MRKNACEDIATTFSKRVSTFCQQILISQLGLSMGYEPGLTHNNPIGHLHVQQGDQKYLVCILNMTDNRVPMCLGFASWIINPLCWGVISYS
jgi:hypothetical protein